MKRKIKKWISRDGQSEMHVWYQQDRLKKENVIGGGSVEVNN